MSGEAKTAGKFALNYLLPCALVAAALSYTDYTARKETASDLREVLLASGGLGKPQTELESKRITKRTRIDIAGLEVSFHIVSAWHDEHKYIFLVSKRGETPIAFDHAFDCPCLRDNHVEPCGADRPDDLPVLPVPPEEEQPPAAKRVPGIADNWRVIERSCSPCLTSPKRLHGLESNEF